MVECTVLTVIKVKAPPPSPAPLCPQQPVRGAVVCWVLLLFWLGYHSEPVSVLIQWELS